MFSKPDSALLWLGVIGFAACISEGVMFDWAVFTLMLLTRQDL
jgi:hypothetical protein